MKLTDILKELCEDVYANEYDIIIESPMKIGSWNASQLDTNIENYKFTKSVKDKAKSPKDKFGGLDVYSYQVNGRNYDLFVGGDLSYAFFSYKLNGKTMTEEKVWQDVISLGLCRKIILNYYIKQYEEIISDAMHTEFGERYWKKLLTEAKKMGLTVSLCVEGEYHNLDVDHLDQYFSESPKFMGIRFSIKR